LNYTGFLSNQGKTSTNSRKRHGVNGNNKSKNNSKNKDSNKDNNKKNKDRKNETG
jgi:hypothetical protein